MLVIQERRNRSASYTCDCYGKEVERRINNKRPQPKLKCNGGR